MRRAKRSLFSRARTDRRTPIGAALLALLAVACADNGFDPPSLVRGPRILAVIVEPADAAPGEDLTIEAIVADPTERARALRWSTDLGPATLARSAGQALGSDGPRLGLGEGERVVLGGAQTAAAIEALDRQIGAAELGTVGGVVRYVYETVGLTATVRVALEDANGAAIVEADKRFVLSPRAVRTTNPPPPRFAVAGIWYSARDGDPRRCVPETEAATVAAGGEVELAPDPDEGWLESFVALDLDGERFEGRESAYYSWFASEGAFSSPVTRAPAASVRWTAPQDVGTVSLWLVVRDGHLGVSACRAEIEVR